MDVKYVDSSEATIAQRDPLGLRAALVQLLHDDPAYMRVLCMVLSIDYHCLQYNLPPQCSHMFESQLWMHFVERCE